MESWQRLTDAPLSRVNHQAVCLQDRIFVFGGFNSQMFDVDYNERQIDTFVWDIHKNRWEQLPYPLLLKSWDCTIKSWGPDPILESSGSIQPSLRFGHTVVAWRGRGWLFGGRMQKQVCSNQLYMFDPGSRFLCQSVGRPVVSGSIVLSHTVNGKKFHPPCWAEVRGTVGSVPSPRDGHSATVLENAMFIFGGFEDVFDNYDNSVYRLDFITWNWTRIEIRDDLTSFSTLSLLNVSCDANRNRQFGTNLHEYVNCIQEDRSSCNQTTSYPRTPLPRDFACLTSHQGRIFLFGGRSRSPNQPSCDVYDSAIWELIPVANVSDYSSSDMVSISEEEKLTPAKCDVCDAGTINYLGTTPGGLLHILWEEETGNWSGPEFWATSPPRPCCLGKFINSGCMDDKSCVQNNYKLPSNCHSRWSSGSAIWIIRHPGHGLQSPEVLLSHIFNKVNGLSKYEPKLSSMQSSSSSSTPSLELNSPYGRRSLSHWSYNGNLYIAFGAIRSQTGRSLQLHYQDVWRFNLSTYSWTQLTYVASMKSSNLHMHLPSARRRAVACLYMAAPDIPYYDHDFMLIKQHPRVFVFGGTQPRALNEKISLANNHNINSSNNSHNNTRFISESSSASYSMFPHRSLFNSNWGDNNRTQNEVLGLRRSNFTLKSFVSILCIQFDDNYDNTIINPNNSTSYPSAFSSSSSFMSSLSTTTINFYLILIIPSHLCNSHMLNGINPLLIFDFILLSKLFIINFNELSELFNKSTNIHNDDGDDISDNNSSKNSNNVSPFIKYLQSTLPHRSASPNTSTTTNNNNYCGNGSNNDATVDEIIHHFHLAWLSLTNKCSTRYENVNNDGIYSVSYSPLSRFHIIFVVNCPTPCNCLSASSETNQDYKPVILKRYQFYQNPHGIILPIQSYCINHTSDVYISSQLINVSLKSVVYILFEAIERGLKYAYSKNSSISTTTTTTSLSSAYNDINDIHHHNFLAYKTFFIYSDIDMEELDSYATYVYMDVNQIASVINSCMEDISDNNNNYNISSSLLSSTSNNICKSCVLSYTPKSHLQQTVSSILLKYLHFIQTSFHLTLEENNVLSQQEMLQSLCTDPAHFYSNDSNVSNINTLSMPSVHFTVRSPYQSTDSSTANLNGSVSDRHTVSSTSNDNNHSQVSGSSQYFLSERLALEMLNSEIIFNFTGIGMYSGSVAGDGSFTLNPPHATVDEEDEINGDIDDGNGDYDGNVGGGDEYADNNDDDSKDTDYSELHCIPNIGVLSKGTEKLTELSDCYTFSFDTSLYELCLRSSSSLAQEPIVTQILPSSIVNDLKHIYSSQTCSMRRSRFG
ncbi:hypothetical protein MN116_007840 [Schistosoma mekongi]|uniref:Uncharacterized protein n=1 Tax=Schistosoma mekongi TaxID=38744 RepID=A0AAE2D383_SCHME|nr:hypothetical protein MN116_007840 [Schistosoma mekongi]